MNTTYHTLETEEIQSLQPGTLVQLAGKLGIFLGKDSVPNGRIATYSFLMNGDKAWRFNGTKALMYGNLRKVT